jgi:streptogramin lyase
LGFRGEARFGLALTCALAACGQGEGVGPAGPTAAAATVAITTPVAATLVGGAIELRGRGFGAPASGSALVIEGGSGRSTLSSTAAEVRVWQDDRIAATLPAAVGSGTVRVETAQGPSAAVPLDVYRYDFVSIPPTPGTNAVPLAVALDGAGRVWVDQEFHLDFQVLDPGTGRVTAIGIPKPPNPGPFATTIFGDQRTQISVLGEGILVDPAGRVWFTQGGGYLYDGAFPNHSRIVSYEPASGHFRIYNVPGDQNEVIGIAWDASRGRVWFAQGGTKAGGRLASFDPERVPFDNTFDFSTSLDSLVNPPDPAAGYRVYALPRPGVQPAHIAIDPDGHVWFSEFFGNAVGRLDPATGAMEEFPLPRAIGTSPQAAFAGGGAFSILMAPDGAVVLSESFDNTVSRLDARRVRAGDAACRGLDSAGRNPCLREQVAPDADQSAELVHSLAFDTSGRLWYTQHGPDIPAGPASLGFVTPDFSFIVRLPPLPRAAGEPATSAAGLAIDPRTGDIWFAELWSKRIGRLRRAGG